MLLIKCFKITELFTRIKNNMMSNFPQSSVNIILIRTECWYYLESNNMANFWHIFRSFVFCQLINIQHLKVNVFINLETKSL